MHHSTKPSLTLQLPRIHTTLFHYLPGPATRTTPAGRVLDGVRDPTQGSASLAFSSCTGPGLVPVLPARCHRCSIASGSLWPCDLLLHFPEQLSEDFTTMRLLIASVVKKDN